MRKLKRLISIALLLALILSPFVRNEGGGDLFVLPVSAATSGDLGVGYEHLTWTLDNGVLTISGTGDMPDWDADSRELRPWHDMNLIIGEIIIGDGVTSIGDHAFWSMRRLLEVKIPDSVISIGYRAFLYTAPLFEIEIPDSVISIGDMAFANCHRLERVTIGDSVETIGYTAFASTALEEIVIPASVNFIGDWAFENCTSLTSITFLSDTPPVFGGNSVFGGINFANLTINFPDTDEAKAAYNTALAPFYPPVISPSIVSPPPIYVAPVVEDDYEEIVQTPEPVVDDSVVQSVERGGALHVTLTAANIAALRSDDGVLTLDLTGHDDIRLTIALDGFEVGDVLVVITDSGTIRLTGAMLRAMRSDTVTLRLGKV